MRRIQDRVERHQREERPTIVVNDETHLITIHPLLAPYTAKPSGSGGSAIGHKALQPLGHCGDASFIIGSEWDAATADQGSSVTEWYR